MTTEFLDGKVSLHAGDCREVIRTLVDASIDSVVTDPPYALVSIGKRFGADGAAPAKAGKTGAYTRASAGFMGKKWDTGETAFAEEFWAEVLRVLKPGGHVVAFGGTRSYHRLACAIEDAGFEIRDQLAWVYGSGFPKSHDVSKAIDRHNGDERVKVRIAASAVGNMKGRQDVRPFIEAARERGYHELDGDIPASAASAAWEGWGTALKPAWEPIVLARKPLVGTVAETVLAHGTGALNIGACRVETSENLNGGTYSGERRAREGVSLRDDHPDAVPFSRLRNGAGDFKQPGGRWPANIVHDGSDEVVAAFPDADGQRAAVGPRHGAKGSVNVYGDYGPREEFTPRGDSGSAARFFYSAKADANDRIGSKHPTVKPVDLMQWLCRLVTPPGGTVLDPFAGTGTTGEAAWREGFSAVLIEREADYQADIARRMQFATASKKERREEHLRQRSYVGVFA